MLDKSEGTDCDIHELFTFRSNQLNVLDDAQIQCTVISCPSKEVVTNLCFTSVAVWQLSLTSSLNKTQFHAITANRVDWIHPYKIEKNCRD